MDLLLDMLEFEFVLLYSTFDYRSKTVHTVIDSHTLDKYFFSLY